MKKRIILRGLAICAVVWVGVVAAQKFFGSYRTTAESLQEAVSKAELEDWSKKEGEPGEEEGEKRKERIQGIAKIINQLDFKEREKARDQRLAEDLFWKLSTSEQLMFVDLTIKESMAKWMEAFDGLPKDEQRKFVEKGLKDFEKGVAEEDLDRMTELGTEMLDKIMKEGFRAYLENTSAETKMELAPLMESMNEMMQGLRGNEWDPDKGS